MSGDNGVGQHETSVVGNGPDRIHNKHAKVSPPLPHPAAARWWAEAIGEEDGGTEDTAAAPEARDSLSSHREQVFLLFLCDPDQEEEEELQFILAFLSKKSALKSL